VKETTRTPLCHCPYCGKKMTAATGKWHDSGRLEKATASIKKSGFNFTQRVLTRNR
jgi:hypothetical protein